MNENETFDDGANFLPFRVRAPTVRVLTFPFRTVASEQCSRLIQDLGRTLQVDASGLGDEALLKVGGCPRRIVCPFLPTC